ncbi:tyrosine-type recombinase/integrase, partial [Pseudomonadales bacterium]|nr:tyrosine-type recombinase/integrase [Pseudomonadales bacterium]
LKTKHLDTAIERAENEFFAIKANLNSGKRIFSPTVQQAAEEYLQYRWDVDVKRGSITEGRWGTVKSQLNHFVAYCGIVGRSEQSSVTRLNDLESKSLQGYQQYRQQKGAKDVTIKNEQATINALCKWAFNEGLHSVQHYVFPSISRKGVDADTLRRGTYTDDEYRRITRALITYTSKKTAKAEFLSEEELFTRQLVRHFFLIGANTMMRFGEQYQLKWSNVETYSTENQRLVTINVLAETSKVRQSRVIKVRGGKHFDRLRSLCKHAKQGDWVFTAHNGERVTRDALYYHYAQLMKLAGIGDWKERNLTYYSTRHYGITKRLQSNANPLTLSKVCGTSLKHLTETYYHADLTEQERAALQRYEGSSSEVVALD